MTKRAIRKLDDSEVRRFTQIFDVDLTEPNSSYTLCADRYPLVRNDPYRQEHEYINLILSEVGSRLYGVEVGKEERVVLCRPSVKALTKKQSRWLGRLTEATLLRSCWMVENAEDSSHQLSREFMEYDGLYFQLRRLLLNSRPALSDEGLALALDAMSRLSDIGLGWAIPAGPFVVQVERHLGGRPPPPKMKDGLRCLAINLLDVSYTYERGEEQVLDGLTIGETLRRLEALAGIKLKRMKRPKVSQEEINKVIAEIKAAFAAGPQRRKNKPIPSIAQPRLLVLGGAPEPPIKSKRNVAEGAPEPPGDAVDSRKSQHKQHRAPRSRADADRGQLQDTRAGAGRGARKPASVPSRPPGSRQKTRSKSATPRPARPKKR